MGIVANDVLLKTAKELLLRAIEINGAEVKSIEEANWNLGYAQAAIAGALDILDLLEFKNDKD